MTPDSTHPARKFEGIFRLKNWASPAIPVPISHPDTLNLIKLLTGGKAKLTLSVGVEHGSGIRRGVDQGPAPARAQADR
jgi:hypothetical protein